MIWVGNMKVLPQELVLLIWIDEVPAMTLLAVQRANVAGEEARQVLNSDFSKLDS